MMEHLYEVISFLVGGFCGFLGAYLKEKGKNRALVEDVSRLEDEKQKVQIKYSRELEEYKKENVLNVELRKHKYNDKKNQFTKYFALLDDFNRKSNEVFQDQFGTIFSKFAGKAMSGEGAIDESFASEFSLEIAQLINEIGKDYLRISTEANSIRLVSSDAVDGLIDQLNKLVGDSTKTTQDMLKTMGTLEFWNDQSILNPLTEHAIKQGQEIIHVREALRKQMKAELDEI